MCAITFIALMSRQLVGELDLKMHVDSGNNLYGYQNLAFKGQVIILPIVLTQREDKRAT